jgi:signal transduction histidine kinase
LVELWLDQVPLTGVLHARITVDDRGPGVPAHLRERIFEPFYRLAGASEKEGGVGLGLALVRTIARKHGGDVRCEDRPCGGARFVVDLPPNIH